MHLGLIKEANIFRTLDLASGFLLITIGDTIIGDYLNIANTRYNKDIVEEIVEISGFLLVIIAVVKS